MAEKKITDVMGATGVQGGYPAGAFQSDRRGESAVCTMTPDPRSVWTRLGAGFTATEGADPRRAGP